MNVENNSSKIIYLIGKPGTGKYTIAKEIAKYGYIVCDNQLINNPIFALLGYKGFGNIPSYGWNAIGKIRNIIFDFMKIERDNNYVLTNCLYEDEGDKNCYSQVEQIAVSRGSLFVPVKLLISEEEHLKRITQETRKLRYKSIDPEDVYSKQPLINIVHPNLLELDVSELSAEAAAARILSYIQTS